MKRFMQRCPGCQKPVPRLKKFGPRPAVQFCSDACVKNYKLLMGRRKRPPHNTAIVGAMSELTVALDLLERGFHVFRSVAPVSLCDFVIVKPGDTPQRVEVKTAYKSPTTGTLTHPKADPATYDILALVVQHREITYIPPFTTLVEPKNLNVSKQVGSEPNDSAFVEAADYLSKLAEYSG